jgi:uncharacterized protein
VSIDVELGRHVALLLTRTQARCRPLAQALIECSELLPQLRHVDHRFEHQHVERAHCFRRLFDRLTMHLCHLGEGRRSGAITHGRIPHFAAPAIEHATHEFAQEALFGSEAVTNQASAVAGAFADCLERSLPKAALGDQLECCREQTTVTGLRPLGLSAGRKTLVYELVEHPASKVYSWVVLRHPQLVSASGPAELPRLRARRCACGYVFHPPHGFGCERCGRSGEETQPIEIAAEGVLAAFATVHAHPRLPAPYVVGRIALDGGAVLDAWIDGTEASLRLGQRVQGKLVSGGTNDTGEPLFDLRFAPAEDH